MINGIDYYRKYEPIFGEWTIDKLLGEGSSGEVFRITKQNPDGTESEAALKAICIPKSDMEFKILQNEGFSPEGAKEYLKNVAANIVREYSLMAQFDTCPNVVNYQDHVAFKHESGVGWDILIRMELLTPVADHFRENQMTLHDVISLGISMCRALEECHKANIIHRDIKPENIFVDHFGNFKLGDFGIAREIEKTQTGLTRTGTLTYMAPEVYRGEAYGKTIDIYSLGIVLYKLVNHNRIPFSPRYPEPFTYESREIANNARMSGKKFPYPDGTNFREFSDVILKAASFRPEDRFANASQMRIALENLLTLPAFEKIVQGDSMTEYISDISSENILRLGDIPKEKMWQADNRSNVKVNKENKRKESAKKHKVKAGKGKASKGSRVRNKSFFDNKLAVAAVVFLPTLIVIGVIVAAFFVTGGKDSGEIVPPPRTPVVKIHLAGYAKDTFEASEVIKINDEATLGIAFNEGERNKIWIFSINEDDVELNNIDLPFGEFGDMVKEIIVDKSIGKLGANVFGNFNNLETVEIQSGEIENFAFEECENLTTVVLGEDVTHIGDDAFKNCSSLSEIVIYGENVTFGSEFFNSVSSDEEIFIYAEKDSSTYDYFDDRNEENRYAIRFIEEYNVDKND